jgi:adenosylcobinamide-GDP ribazoletransferase
VAEPEKVGRSTPYFPVVGLIIGLILAGLNWLFNLILPTSLVNALLIVFLVIITGAMHLDGFIDTCDGIAGHRTAEDRREVMRDSRVGAFGVIGAILLLLTKFVSLSNVPAPLMMTTLVFMPVVSRWAVAYAVFAYPYARPDGLGKAFKQRTRWPGFTVATFITLVIAVVLIPLLHLAGLLVMFVVWIITLIMTAYFKSKFSGLTGDNYGAINELAETSVLIFIVMLSSRGIA